VTAEDVVSAGFEGMRFVLRIGAARQNVAIPTLGRMSVHNALAAAAVGRAAGLALPQIAAGLAPGWSAPHRAQVIRAGGVAIVDDSYNASPRSVTAALELLAGLPGRRGAVLGEMLELGDASEDGHRTVGEAAARTVDWLVVVGRDAAPIAEGALDAGMDPARITTAADVDAVVATLPPRLRIGDVVLVKASRGIGLDRVVDGLREELERGSSGRVAGSVQAARR
jgi:UDP-N-acetylmuramoyl-tripeptide--D-alanyl-D-alanine ligase